MALEKSKYDLQQEAVRTSSKRKSTAKWCKGKVGREHVTEIVLNHTMVSFKTDCGWRDIYLWRSGQRQFWRWQYSCRHSLKCVNCGKYTDYYLEPEQCPDFKPKPTIDA